MKPYVKRTCGHDDAPSGGRGMCHACYMKWWSKTGAPESSREAKRRQTQRRRAKYRNQLLELLGNKCACCSESNREFLSIDHIDGGGAKHRYGNSDVYYKILMQEDKSNYRILCHNCNQSMGFYGYCPHGNIPTATYYSRIRWKNLLPIEVRELVTGTRS